VVALSLLVNIALIYKFIISGETIEIVDQRTAIVLDSSERELVLSEMRLFLAAVQSLSSAISSDDMASAAAAARSVGGAAAQGVPGSLMAKLPLEFKKLGMATHKAFDQMAMDAADLGDREHTLQQLSSLLNNCVACHASYQITLTPQ